MNVPDHSPPPPCPPTTITHHDQSVSDTCCNKDTIYSIYKLKLYIENWTAPVPWSLYTHLQAISRVNPLRSRVDVWC